MSRPAKGVKGMINARAIAAAVALALAAAVPAGPINPPPGPVTSTHKTLTEVEPRIAVNAVNTPGNAEAMFAISQPGSYYLTGHLTGVPGKHGIQINADGVTLDLSGFTLAGVPGSLSGVSMPNYRLNVVVRNGHVRQWGEHGVQTRSDTGRIERITAARNGGWGIDADNATFSSHIVSCEAFGNGIAVGSTGGIRAGQAALVRDCVADGNAGRGISVANGCLVAGCLANDNNGDGIAAVNSGIITGCNAYINDGDGIRVGGSCRVVGNTCTRNGNAGDGAGIHATAGDNQIEGNLCTGSDRGIDVDVPGNFIARNRCAGNSNNWDVVAGNTILVVSATPAPAVSGDSGGLAPGSADPSANFSY